METAALVFAGLSLLAAVIAIWLAWTTLRRSDRNASAATLVSLHEALRGAWSRFLAAQDLDDRDFEFAELINVIELSCAIVTDRAVHGAAREILRDYLADVIALMAEDDDTRARVGELKDRPRTFKYLKLFILGHPDRARLAALLPSVVNSRTVTSTKSRPSA